MSDDKGMFPIGKAFKQGYNAFRAGNFDNPYEDDFYKAREWQRGFDRAYYNNLAFVQRRERQRKQRA